MNSHPTVRALIAAMTVVIFPAHGRSDDANGKKVPDPQQVRQAVERSLVFLEKDAVKWRSERQCATCHHGTMTVWAFSEAKNLGYAVEAKVLEDAAAWTKEQWLPRADSPRDPRPGWHMVSTPFLYLTLMAAIVPKQEVLSSAELDRIAGSLMRHQEADGSWAWSEAPALNRPPPVFESDEVATLLAYLGLQPHLPGDLKASSPVCDSREKAVAWLSKNAPNDTTQAMVLRLLVQVREGKSRRRVQSGIDELIRRQNADGGWGQLKNIPSDAYATGQVLYVLSLANVKDDRREIQRAVSFLVTSQREDGSWPMTSRLHPGVEKPSTNPVPITYFGSAWATMGLMRTLPK